MHMLVHFVLKRWTDGYHKKSVHTFPTREIMKEKFDTIQTQYKVLYILQ